MFASKSADTSALLECPHDGNTMARSVVAGVTIDRCESCGGTWFDERELRRVAADKEVEELASRVPMTRIASPFACPRCGGACVEGHVSAVEVDTCTQCHGVWLDRGELAEAKRQVHAEKLAAAYGFRGFLVRI